MSRGHFVPAVLALLFVRQITIGAEPFRYPEATWGTGKLSYQHGIPVLEIAGSPEEMGTAAGVLALKPGQRMASYPEDLVRHFHAGFAYSTMVREGRKMARHFPADYASELEALAAASGVPRDRLVVGNTLFDLKKAIACSAILVEPQRSATGAPMLGRNLDYPPLSYAHDYSLVTVYRPTGKRAFASIGFPGLLGTLSGMNDAGLAVSVLECYQMKPGMKKLDRKGVPYALCYRRLLEECSTIAEAKTLLSSMHRASYTNLVLADRTGIALLEVSPERVAERKPEQGIGLCTNHFSSDELKPWLQLNLFHTLNRYRKLEAATAGKQTLSLEQVHQGLHAASHPEHTMQTMIFEPATLTLRIAIGPCPSSGGEMHVLDLGPYFRAGLN